MSLRVFHLFFIAVSILLCGGVGAWGVASFAGGGESLHLVLGIVSTFGGGILVWYGVRIRRKLNQLAFRWNVRGS